MKKLMSLREEIDSNANGIDYQDDLPVYHRIDELLTKLHCDINEFDNEQKKSFRPFAQIILQFDKTFALLVAKLLIKIAQNKEDFEQTLTFLQENLSQFDFQGIIIELQSTFSDRDSCPFIQQLNMNQKLDLAQWLMEEKNRSLFVFDLLTNNVFNQSDVNQEQCQTLLRQIRQSENLLLRQKALEYRVFRNENTDQDQMSVSSDESN
jgi:hypothetical protein